MLPVPGLSNWQPSSLSRRQSGGCPSGDVLTTKGVSGRRVGGSAGTRTRDVLRERQQPLELLAKLPKSIQSFVAKYHTTTEQLAELASKAKPKLLVIYHTISFPPGIAPPRLLPPNAGADALYASPDMLQKEIGSRYSGKFVIGKDLDVY